MQAMKALVKGGRLLLDVPTDRPDGEVVVLVRLDGLFARELGEACEVIATTPTVGTTYITASGKRVRRVRLCDAAPEILETTN